MFEFFSSLAIMRLFSILSASCLVTSAVSLPYAIPVANSKFEIQEYVQDMMRLEGYDSFSEFMELNKRDQDTVDKLLETVNSSGIIFTLLDQIADHPERIGTLANLTGNLIKSHNFSLDLGSLGSMASGLNISAIYTTVQKSGLVTSLLDGILLDDNYRPVLVDLIYRIVRANTNLIMYIVDGIFQPRNLNKKRADNSGSLQHFVTNIISSVLSSSLVAETATDVVNALNDTGVAVYVVKRLIADESYQNMTALFIKDFAKTGALKLNAKSLNITAILNSALLKPKVLTDLVGGLLSGKVNLSGLGKYTGAIGKIVSDLEAKGLFQQLNNEIFPSSTTRAATSPTKTAAKKEAMTASVSVGSSAAPSSSKAGSTSDFEYSNVPVIKALFYIQSLLFGGAFLFL